MIHRNGRGVAQLGSALAWGARGRRFESSRPDQFFSVSFSASPSRPTRSHLGILAVCCLLLCTNSAQALVNATKVSDDRYQTEFSWVVSVGRTDGAQICGGALIAPTWVLTAAHCTNMNRYVVVGNASRSAGKKIMLKRAIRHPKFSGEHWRYDVGLLELESPVNIEPVDMASAAQIKAFLLPNASVLIAGWGKTPFSNKPVDRLRSAEMRLQKLMLERTQFAFRSRSGPCGNDSGAPLSMHIPGYGRALIAITSRTEGNLCSKGGGLAVYARVDAALSFIKRFVTLGPEPVTLQP
jgi:secreted trypsin-like serine protease